MINAVIDISHHNGKSLNFAKAKADGIVGVIHKASQGQANTDPMYKANRKKATDAGLLWGAYHFATGSSATAQAEHFLESVGDLTNVLLVLDFEPNPNGQTMSLSGAHDFVSFVEQETGRFPGLYSGHLIKQLLGSANEVLARLELRSLGHNLCNLLFGRRARAATTPRTSQGRGITANLGTRALAFLNHLSIVRDTGRRHVPPVGMPGSQA